MPHVITLEEIQQRKRLERIMVYGKAKTGKSRLVGAIPRGEKWGKQIIVLAADRGSELLPSTIDSAGIVPIKPGNEDGSRYDVLEEWVGFANKDWKAEYPDAGTLVIDTGTQQVQDLMQFYVDTKAMQSGHRTLGRPGTKSFHGFSDKSDYGGAQGTHTFLLDAFWNQPLHLVVLYHEDWIEPKAGSLDELVGGPMTVGFAQIRTLPGRFDTVLRTMANGTTFQVQTKNVGAWPAEIRHPNESGELGKEGIYQLKGNPRHFWEDFDRFVAGEAPVSVGASAAPNRPTWT